MIKLGEFSRTENHWDYKQRFKQIESSLEEKNELINSSNVSKFIDKCFTSLNSPKEPQAVSYYERVQRLKQRKASVKSQAERQRHKKEVFEMIKDTKYGDLFAVSIEEPQLLHQKLTQLNEDERTAMIEDVIDFLDQDISLFKKKKPQRG